MGNRTLMQVVNKADGEFGPAVYGHWSGRDTKKIVAKLATRMHDRPGDVQYASARLVQCMMKDDGDNTGFGIWNVDHVLTVKDTHGDAGVTLIYCDEGFRCEHFGGYLK